MAKCVITYVKRNRVAATAERRLEYKERNPKMSADTNKKSKGLARLCMALSDPTRMRIMVELQRGPLTVTQLSKSIGASQPTVSHHVGILRRCGLLRVRQNGRLRIYNIKKMNAFSGLGRDLHKVARSLGMKVNRTSARKTAQGKVKESM